MTKAMRNLSLFIAILGVLSVVIGAIFIEQGFAKQKMIVDRMRVEKVSLSLDPNNPGNTTAVNNAVDAQKAADLIATHRRAIAPTYQDLLAGGKFDPTKPVNLTYAQAMNLENYLYLAVMAFGLVQVVQGAGAFMLITGIALFLIGLILRRLPLKTA